MLQKILAKALRYISRHDDLDGSHDLQAPLIYLKPMRERPRNYAQTLGGPHTNAVYEPSPTKIKNLRRLPVAPVLDVQGFTLVNESTVVKDFYDDAQVRSAYYREAEDLLKKVTGASQVLIIDHITRRRPVNPENGGIGKSRKPVLHVHVDFTPNSAALAIQSAAERGISGLPEGRVQIINVWRPIRGPLSDAPLAVCDARTVAPNDLVPTDMVYPDKVWETYSVTRNPGHQWFYVPGMRADEALLFKCFDSADDGRARFTPHAAFYDPTVSAQTIPRESIEVRALVFD
jgi:hypothetical protein